MVEDTDLDEVWFVVSPQSPFKDFSTLANEDQRLKMVQLATRGNPKLRASKIEFALPRPSYTIDTLDELKRIHSNDSFVIIMGEDNLKDLPKWKSFKRILKEFTLYVYKRSNSKKHDFGKHQNVQIFNVPFIDISATRIRQRIASHKSIQYLVPNSVFKYLSKNKIYRKTDNV